MYRIVEKLDRYGDPIFEIEKTVKKLKYIFFGKEYFEWKPLTIIAYTRYVNEQYRFQHYEQKFRFLSQAKSFLKMYEEYLEMKPFEYRGEKLNPILYNGNSGIRITYYDPKSYYRRNNYDYGYRLYSNTEDFKKMVDNKLDKGKTIKIHNV